MKSYRTEQLRNVAIVGHGSAGKTTLAEALLFTTGATTRLGKVEEGNTASDYDPDEIRRHMSISLSVVPCEWRDSKINLIDTPGFPDFVGEVREGLRVADSVISVVDVVGGVEVGTELTWKYADEYGLPRFIWLNKIDRENADFGKTVDQLRSMFGSGVVPIYSPIGAQDKFGGVVDLVRERARVGAKLEDAAIPAEAGDYSRYREMLIETVAEQDDDLLAKYLEGEALTNDEILHGLKLGVVSGKVIPVLVGSASQNRAVASLLDALVDLAPSPVDRGAVAATGASSDAITLEASADGPLAALVFKTAADPFVGKLTYFRVYSGTFKADNHVWNVNRSHDERVGSVFFVRGKAHEATPSVLAGDIGTVTKLTETGTGDTLASKEKPITLAGISFPEPSFAAAVHPKAKSDVEKMGTALHRLEEEDPTIHVRREPDTGETIVSGIGESHIDVSLEKVKRKFGAELTTSLPKVPYKETITMKTQAEYKHKKQTGGHGQYGHVFLELEPLPRGTGSEVTERVVGGAVPKNFYPAVEKGVHEALVEGVVAHFPVVDIRVVLYDGSFHPVDSSEMAFKIAASQAFKKGVQQAHPVLLEPVMDVEVTVPEQFMGDILSDINTKRARVSGMNTSAGIGVVNATVPLAELLRYSTDLRSITQGRGSFTMKFSHYEEVPGNISNHVVAEAKAAFEAAHGHVAAAAHAGH